MALVPGSKRSKHFERIAKNMNSQIGERMNSLLGTLGELFPEAKVSVVARLGATDHALRLIPSKSNPRLAVPAANSRAAMWSAIRPCASDRLSHKIRRYSIAMLLRTPLAARLMPSGIEISSIENSLLQELEQIFDKPVCIGVMTGSARANRKPVLGIFDHSGVELGFAKIGLSALASELVYNEHRALQAMNSTALRGVQVPKVIAMQEWNGKPVLVMSTLRPNAWQKPLGLPLETVQAIVASAPVKTQQLDQSDWYFALTTALEELPEVNEARKLLKLLDKIALNFGSTKLSFGAWHGDFGPWNMARTASAPMVWDWERYSDSMPLGIDLYHFAAHEFLTDIGDYTAARTSLSGSELRNTALSLHGFYTPSAQQLADVLPLLYLATMATRFVADGHHYDVPDTFALGAWYTEVLKKLSD